MLKNGTKKVKEGLVPIYENEKKERMINARELFYALRGNKTKMKFADWIKERLIKYEFLENIDYICFRKFTKAEKYGNKTTKEYYLTFDTSKEICMIESNKTGRSIRRYFIEVEKRYRKIINNPSNIFDFMRLVLNQIEENTKDIDLLKLDVKELQLKIDIKIQNDYCLASDIAEQLHLYSENKIPHSNFIGAIARELGYKISYKHYYKDEYIA